MRKDEEGPDPASHLTLAVDTSSVTDRFYRLARAVAGEEANELFRVVKETGTETAKETATKGQEQIEEIRKSRVEAWNGIWIHSFTSSLGKFTGSMTLQAKDDGRVSGTFDAKSKSLQGSISGQLSYDRTVMKGDWQNSLGQGGPLLFILNSDSTFEGNYSMFEADPVSGSSLRWTGSKN